MGLHTERPLGAVPASIVLVLLLGLCTQVLTAWYRPAPVAQAEQLPKAPSPGLVRLFALGEETTLARILMLWLQAFDNQPGISIPFRDLDYERVIGWLELVMVLDTRSSYPLLSASRVYTEVPDDARKRRMLEFVHDKFLLNPDRYWPWLAHCVYVAKHRLEDRELALVYARALRENLTDPGIPAWVTQMEIFVYEDLGDRKSAMIIIGGLLESGKLIPGSNEERFLLEKLEELKSESVVAD